MSTDLNIWRQSRADENARKPVRIGPKLMDGLRAIDAYQREGLPFADYRLEAMGYPLRMAGDILDRLDRKSLIECGTSVRSGWLTNKGRRVLMTGS